MKQIAAGHVWISKSGKLVLVKSHEGGTVNFQCLNNGVDFKRPESYVRSTYKLLGLMPAPGDVWCNKKDRSVKLKIYGTNYARVKASYMGETTPTFFPLLKDIVSNYFLYDTVNPRRLPKLPMKGETWVSKARNGDTVTVLESTWEPDNQGNVLFKGWHGSGEVSINHFISLYEFLAQPAPFGRMLRPPKEECLIIDYARPLPSQENRASKEISAGEVWFDTFTKQLITVVNTSGEFIYYDVFCDGEERRIHHKAFSKSFVLKGVMPVPGDVWEAVGKVHKVGINKIDGDRVVYRDINVVTSLPLITFLEKFTFKSTHNPRGVELPKQYEVWSRKGEPSATVLIKYTRVDGVVARVYGVIGNESRTYFLDLSTFMETYEKQCDDVRKVETSQHTVSIKISREDVLEIEKSISNGYMPDLSDAMRTSIAEGQIWEVGERPFVITNTFDNGSIELTAISKSAVLHVPVSTLKNFKYIGELPKEGEVWRQKGKERAIKIKKVGRLNNRYHIHYAVVDGEAKGDRGSLYVSRLLKFYQKMKVIVPVACGLKSEYHPDNAKLEILGRAYGKPGECVTQCVKCHDTQSQVEVGQLWDTPQGIVEVIENDFPMRRVKIKFLSSNVTAKTDVDVLVNHGEFLGHKPRVGETWEKKDGTYHYVKNIDTLIQVWRYSTKADDFHTPSYFMKNYKRVSTELAPGQVWKNMDTGNNFIIYEVPQDPTAVVSAMAMWRDGRVALEKFTRTYFTPSDSMRLVGKV